MRDIEALRAFASEIIRDLAFQGGDGGDVIQEAAVKYGLLREEAYDTVKHGPDDYAMPGDPYFVFTDVLREIRRPG